MGIYSKGVALAALCALGGCAMSPARVAQLPTQELCIDQAEAQINGVASEGAMQTRVRAADIDAALSERGATCDDADYEAIAAQRLELQQERNAAMASALAGMAAAYNQAIYASRPEVVQPPAPPPAAPVYNGRMYTPHFQTQSQPAAVPTPAAPIGSELSDAPAPTLPPIEPTQVRVPQSLPMVGPTAYEAVQEGKALDALEAAQQAQARADATAAKLKTMPGAKYCYIDASGNPYCVPIK